MQSKRSADSQPEFFLDRCLGRITGLRLRDLGWSLLTQDKRIRYRSAELGALADGGGTMFCLSSGNLMIQAVALYVVYADRIERRWP